MLDLSFDVDRGVPSRSEVTGAVVRQVGRARNIRSRDETGRGSDRPHADDRRYRPVLRVERTSGQLQIGWKARRAQGVGAYVPDLPSEASGNRRGVRPLAEFALAGGGKEVRSEERRVGKEGRSGWRVDDGRRRDVR